MHFLRLSNINIKYIEKTLIYRHSTVKKILQQPIELNLLLKKSLFKLY